MSKSNSKSEANQTTQQQDNRIAASDSAIAVGAGASLVQETVSDDIAISAIEESTRVAREGLDTGADLARDINSDSLTFAGGVLNTAASVFERQLSESTAAQRGLAETAIQNIEKNKRDADSDVIQTVAKYGTVAAVVVVIGIGAVLILRKK